MWGIIKTELLKLKRYHILWAGILLMLFTVLLTLFNSTAEDGTIWTFPLLVEQVIKNNTTTIFPMCITLIAGYMIAREEKDNTLKIILAVPISYRKLLCGKLIVCGFISVFFGIMCALFTTCAEMIVALPVFIHCRAADYCHCRSNAKRKYDRLDCGVCLRLRRNVCRKQ